MNKRSHIIIVFLWALLNMPLLADPGLFCIIEKDTLSAKNGADLERIVDGFTTQIGDQGYPFIEVILDSYLKDGENEYFRYRVDKGTKTSIDTVVFGEYSKREISLLSRYITLPESGAFNYTLVREMIDNLKANPLLNVEERADIYQNGLRLYTAAKQDVRFDAMASYKQENNRQGLVGNVSLELINLGGLGRVANFHWSRPTLGVNSFDLSYTEPYIFNKPFSASLSFSQRYQDSLYVKRDLDLSVIYHLDQRSDLTVNYVNEQISTAESGSDSGFVSQNRSGSNVSLFWQSKPRAFTFYGSLISGLYFSPDRRVSRSELELGTKFRKSVFGFNLEVLGAYVTSEDPIALYDQFKLGGAAFLRGAYFEQYVTNAYLGWMIEAGYFQRIRLFAFYDGVIMDHAVPLSHHVGIGFSLPAGQNRLTIALGMNTDESFRQAKFHLSWDFGE